MTLDEEAGEFSGPTAAKTRTIAFASGKGGVGTSVLLINTAILLARRGKQVLVLDGNLGLGSIHVLLGCTPRFDLRHVAAGEKHIADVLFTGPEGIRIVAAGLGVAELANIDEEDFTTLLGQVGEIKAGYDFVLIDAGSGIGVQTLELVVAADEAIVVTRPEPTALAGAYALMKVVVQRYPAFPFHLLLNMVHGANQAEQMQGAMAKISSRFLGYQPGCAGFVVEDASVRQSVVEQMPFVLQAPRSPATVCLAALVEKLAPKEIGIAAREEGPPLWKRVFRWR